MLVRLLLTLSVCLQAADWTRFGGPTGDFQIPASEPALRWPAGGPKRLWQHPLGEGYSQIAVEGKVLYTMYRRGGQEVVVSLDSDSGKTLWEFVYDAPLQRDFDFSASAGPRSTPLIVDDAVFTTGVTGKLHCLDKKSGKLRWSHDLVREFDGQLRHNGYSASPLAWRDTIIVTPWAPGAAIMALRQSDGAVVWKKHSYDVSYASPSLLKIGGEEQLITQFSDEVTGMDPSNGNLLWSFPHTNDQKVNVASPVWGSDSLMFLSSGYGTGSRVLKVTGSGAATKAEQVWSQTLVRVHHSDIVRIGDVVYAASGDMGPCPLTATDVKTGKLLWRDRTFPKASLVAIGAQLLILDEDGVLALATPTATGLEVHGKMAALEGVAWTPPTVVGKSIYLRDLKTVTALSME